MNPQRAPSSHRGPAIPLIVRATDGRTYTEATGKVPSGAKHFVAYALHEDEVRYLGMDVIFAWALLGAVGFGNDGQVYVSLAYFPAECVDDRARFSGHELQSEADVGLPRHAFESLALKATATFRQFAASGQRSRKRPRR